MIWTSQYRRLFCSHWKFLTVLIPPARTSFSHNLHSLLVVCLPSLLAGPWSQWETSLLDNLPTPLAAASSQKDFQFGATSKETHLSSSLSAPILSHLPCPTSLYSARDCSPLFLPLKPLFLHLTYPYQPTPNSLPKLHHHSLPVATSSPWGRQLWQVGPLKTQPWRARQCNLLLFQGKCSCCWESFYYFCNELLNVVTVAHRSV